MDIALALGHPLHRMGRARKKEASFNTVFLLSFLPGTLLSSLKKQMLGQKAEFAWRQWDILRLRKILVGPIITISFATAGRWEKCVPFLD